MLGPSALRVFALLAALEAAQIIVGQPLTPSRAAFAVVCLAIAGLALWAAASGRRVLLIGGDLPDGPALAAAAIGGAYGFLALLLVGLGGPMPADPAVFAAMTWGLAPYALVPALAFALIWPGSWRWALLLGWGLIAFDAVIAGSELFFASTQPDREAFMAGLNTLVAPLVLFAGMVIAAVAGAWAHSAFAESRRR